MAQPGVADYASDDDSPLIAALKAWFWFVVKILQLPLAALGTISLVQRYWHIQLVPLGQDLLGDYRLVMHALLGGLYWPLHHFFQWQIPAWLRDLATVSIVSSSVNWRATAVDDNSFNWWANNVSLRRTFRVLAPHWDRNWNFFDYPIFILEELSALFALITGWIFHLITRWRWLILQTTILVFIVVRGLTLAGLLLPFRHLGNIIKPSSDLPLDERREIRRDAALFFLFGFITLLSVVWFFSVLAVSQEFGISLPG